jgi:F-box-like
VAFIDPTLAPGAIIYIMAEAHSESEVPSTKQNKALRDRRSRIAAQIKEIELATVLSPVESNRIYNLKEEYNLLVDEEDEIRPERSVDPFEFLPPELWPDILPGTARELLVLTLVCDKWRNAVLSVPKIWCTVDLDGRREDYLALAIACFACSAPLEINLTIDLPLAIWKEVVPLIAAERNRIAHLNIQSFDDGIKPAEGLEILSDLGDLPNLVSVNIPGFYEEPPLIAGDLDGGDLSRAICPGIEALLTRAPSLLNIYGLTFSTEQLRIPGATKLESAQIFSFHLDAIEALGHFPNLMSLRLVEEKDPYGGDKSLPRSLDSSLASITSFEYHGLALNRALRCIGSNLEILKAKYVPIHQLQELFLSLQLFPRLHELSIHIDVTSGGAFAYPSVDAICLSSITSLTLYFCPSFFPWDGDLSEGDINQACDNLFHCLVDMMPHVEEFNLQGKGYRDAAVAYIQSLRKLRSLHFSPGTAEVDRPRLSLSFEQLESVSWYGHLPSGGLFDLAQSSILRKLDLWPVIFFSVGREQWSSEAHPGLSLRSRTLSTPFPSLRALSLVVEIPVAWDLGFFPTLERIELSGHPSAILAGDFFEELLLQPGSCPSLEEVGIRGHYVEWDLLILMLERRNLVTKPGITRIRTIQVASDLSYKLLRPLSTLLRGKYPHRDSIDEFSSTAIGKIIWR